MRLLRVNFRILFRMWKKYSDSRKTLTKCKYLTFFLGILPVFKCVSDVSYKTVQASDVVYVFICETDVTCTWHFSSLIKFLSTFLQSYIHVNL
jgi:hypothetical protein